MTIYYLCNLKDKSIHYAGKLPEVWGNLSGMSEGNDECLKDMARWGHPDMGFLKEEDLLSAGISEETISKVAGSLTDHEMETLRNERDARIWDIRWRVDRYHDESILGIPHKEDILPVLNYIQALRDLPEHCDPKNVDWPVPPP